MDGKTPGLMPMPAPAVLGKSLQQKGVGASTAIHHTSRDFCGFSFSGRGEPTSMLRPRRYADVPHSSQVPLRGLRTVQSLHPLDGQQGR